ncbi:hypothetical protein Godav_002635 [Gossypium davidsonii]|uniref:Alpha/beta hydrolase fold-3 domain-containing protein n=1 Tax=Gossypium davidsonii TaxID=34287 RepID=A0A7J8SWQ5_GOSDV|nr:hypothetical protein [Gossypium davidsonii]
MPSITVKLYSVFFKMRLKNRLQGWIQTPPDESSNQEGVRTRPEEPVSASNPYFTDGIATKDIRVDPSTALSVRIFLPESALLPSERPRPKSKAEESSLKTENNGDQGYTPSGQNCRKLPIMLQFHGGGWVSGSNDSVANDSFCQRIAKLCDAIVVAVGYRLAPESKYPAAFEDGLKVLNWLGKQSSNSTGDEPWLVAHADPSRCVLLGVSCGANIADYVARRTVELGKELDPVKVVAQILMYPFFLANEPTQSEIRLANTYFYDKAICLLAWQLFLPKDEFSLEHPAANPLAPNRGPPLKLMPPTLTVVAEHDWMRDQGVAYSEELRKVNVPAPLLDYKDTVHEFATLEMLLKTPQAEACAEDICIWAKKYISLGCHEFSY